MTGKGDFQIDTDIAPVIVDWNQDGQLDLLLRAWNGSVRLDALGGTWDAPFVREESVLVPSPREDPRPVDPGTVQRRSGIGSCVTDWDADGRLDILCGDARREPIHPEQVDLADAGEKLEQVRLEIPHVLKRFRRLRGAESQARR